MNIRLAITTTLLTAVMAVADSGRAAAQDVAGIRAAIEEHYSHIHAKELDIVFGQHRPEMTWFPVDGRMLFDSAAAASAEAMGATLDWGTINVYMSNFNAQLYGNVAVATFYLTGPSSTMGKTETSTSRVTAVWVYKDGVWTEAHHHESPLRGLLGS